MSSVGFFQNKVFSYIQDNETLAKIHSTPLWHTYQEPLPEAEEYAKKVMNSSLSVKLGLEHTALIAYGDISGDSPYITIKDEDTGVEYTTECVSSPCEYYFTDLVFIQQKYEEAIIDFYNYKVYSFYINNDKHPELLANIDRAIDDTCWLAQKNGININKDEVFAKFVEKIEKLIYYFSSDLNFDLHQKSYLPLRNYIGEAIKKFYLNPSLQTYQNVIDVVKICVEETNLNMIESYITHGLYSESAAKYLYMEKVSEMVKIIDSNIVKYQIFCNLP